MHGRTCPTSRKPDILSLARISTDLGQQNINSERRILVLKMRLQFLNLLPQSIWTVAETPNDADPACIGDGCGEEWACCYAHSCQHNRMRDVEEVRQRRADAFWISFSCFLA
jgi:hypothetical protein